MKKKIPNIDSRDMGMHTHHRYTQVAEINGANTAT